MATFKEIIESYGKELSFGCTAYKSNGTFYKSITEEDVVSENLRYDGALYTCVMRCLDAVLVGDNRELVKESRFSACKLTAKKGSDSKTINYGTFYIGEAPEYDEAENTTKFICYDSMYKTTKPYALEGVTFPITLKEYARKIFAACDLVCANLDELKNGSKLVTEDRYKNATDDSGSAYTYRDVLDDIAKSAGCSFAFKSDANGDVVDRVYVVYVTDGNGNMKDPLHTLDISNFKSLTIGEHYGPANTVVFSRQPQEDNVYLRSSGVTDATAVEVKLTQPLTAEGTDEERGAWLPEILNAVRGTEYRCYALESYGIGYLNFGDVFKIKAYKRNGRTFDYDSPEEYLSVFMRCDMMLNGDIKESSKLEMPVATATDYNAAATPGEKKLLQAYMKVDKQLGEIISVVKDPENGLETLVKQTAAGLLVNAKAVETIKTKQENLEKAFSEIDIEGTVTTEVQKETTLNIIAGRIEGIISGKYASKSDLGDYVKNETYTAKIGATDKQIASSVERISKIETAGYITESEAESIIDSKADSIAMRVTSKLNIGTRNILLDSACFEKADFSFQNAEQTIQNGIIMDRITDVSQLPSGKARTIKFDEATEENNDKSGITFSSKEILGQDENEITKISANKEYTLSFYARYVSSRGTISLDKGNLIYAGQNVKVEYLSNSDLSINSSFKKYTFTFKLSKTPTNFLFKLLIDGINGQQSSFSISSLKLEEGNVATDWTPCVQDTEQFVEARLELCVKTDENGNLQSAIHAKANQITIESDNFTLDKHGNVTCKNGTFEGGNALFGNPEVGLQFQINSDGTIKHKLIDSEKNTLELIRLDQTLSVDIDSTEELKMCYIESIEYTDGLVVKAIDASTYTMVIGSEGSVYFQNAGTWLCTDGITIETGIFTPLNILNDSGEVRLTLNYENRSIPDYTTDYRDIIRSTGGLIVSANNGSNALYLEGSTIAALSPTKFHDSVYIANFIGATKAGTTAQGVDYAFVAVNVRTGELMWVS